MTNPSLAVNNNPTQSTEAVNTTPAPKPAHNSVLAKIVCNLASESEDAAPFTQSKYSRAYLARMHREWTPDSPIKVDLDPEQILLVDFLCAAYGDRKARKRFLEAQPESNNVKHATTNL